MDRDVLQGLLEEGVSLAQIGRQHGLHESTVGYWVEKHGLKAAGKERHAPKGALDRDELETLAQAGLSTRQIAERLHRSQVTVRHWLREYGLTTSWAERRHGSATGSEHMTLECARHGRTTFRLRSSGGYRCLECRKEAVTARRRKVKQILVEEAGAHARSVDMTVASRHWSSTISFRPRSGLR